MRTPQRDLPPEDMVFCPHQFNAEVVVVAEEGPCTEEQEETYTEDDDDAVKTKEEGALDAWVEEAEEF